MKIQVFQSNHNGKIEFTRVELEKLLNDTYADGYNEGKLSSLIWSGSNARTNNITNTLENYPLIPNTTNTTNTTNATKVTNTVGKEPAQPAYTVRVNGTDISKLVNDIFGAGAAAAHPSKTVEDAFDKLAKELNF